MSLIWSSAGGSPPGKSISGFSMLTSSLLVAWSASWTFSQTPRSHGAEDVHHEDQRVLRQRAVGARAVAEGGRDHQQDPVAHALADEALVPAGHHGAGADLEGGGATVVPGGVELLAVLPLDAGVLGDEP